VEYALLLVVVAALVIAFSSKATTAIATLTNTMSTCITTGVCNPFTSSGSGS
jgi:Flp pilus assembly pilin Flp